MLRCIEDLAKARRNQDLLFSSVMYVENIVSWSRIGKRFHIHIIQILVEFDKIDTIFINIIKLKSRGFSLLARNSQPEFTPAIHPEDPS